MNMFQGLSFIPPRKRMGKNGFMLALAAVLIPMLLLLTFSYSSRVRQEALRAHRVYWNDLVTKAAEGVAEEAFAWFISNQDNADNKIALFLKGKPGGDKSITLSTGQIKFIDQLRKANGDSDVITKCTMKLVEEKPFYNSITSLPANFDAASRALIYPDPDMYGLLKVEVEANYHGFRRKYVVIRELKAVNILPGIFGQFTLFVKEKGDETDYDWNHLKNNSTPTPSPVIDTSGFVKKDSSELSNPVVLINDKSDATRTCNKSDIGANDVTPPAPSSWNNLDLTRRGWVFMGRNLQKGPLQDYVFHPMNGDVRTACDSPSADKFLFFGGNFMLSNHTKLWYLLHLNDSNRPPFAHITSGRFEVPVPSPDLKDASRYQIGWIVWQTRFGFMSLTKNLLQAIPLSPPPGLPRYYDLIKNYYEDPRHNVGETGNSELPHSSLILPMGDIFPLDSATISDRRSPTVMMGVWLRFLQVGKVVQIDDNIKSALDMNPVGDWVEKLDDPLNTVKPTTFWFPYFPIHADRSVSPPTISFGPEPDFVGWNNYLNWAKVDDSSSAGVADFAKVTYNVIGHIAKSFGDERDPYEIVMTKFLEVPGMLIYDFLVGQNMRGAVPSLFVPRSPYKLENFNPANLGTVLKPVTTSGVDVSGTNLGKSFFYEGPDKVTQTGRGISGECISLRDLGGRLLALGNIGALWPFPDSSGDTYDLGRKATHNASTPADFLSCFTSTIGGNTVLDLKNGIVTVAGNITLDAGNGKIIYKNGGMLIASDGEIIIKSSIQQDPSAPDATLVIATAKKNKDIRLSAGNYRVFILSSGTLKRETAGPIKIEGGVAVRYLEFKKSASSIFSGYPTSADARQTITWDSNFNVFDPGNYAKGIKLNLGGSMAYWASEKAD
ncbi:MAG: hypothetical protein HQM09_02190 [Candidatus Riflebacteria bacterium]|nr:hypothetical protein [Candidatus Riflebacteria bacterium]